MSEQLQNLIEKQKNTTMSEQLQNLIEKQKNTTMSEQLQNPIKKFIHTDARSISLTYIYKSHSLTH